MEPEPEFTLAALEAAFAEAGEDLGRDLSAVHVRLVRDCHYDLDLTLEVSVHGGGRQDSLPVVCEIVQGPHHLAACDDFERTGAVRARTILSLFEQVLLRILADSGHGIAVNPGWATEAHLRPAGDDPDWSLRPEEC